MIPVRTASIVDWFQQVWELQKHQPQNLPQTLRIVTIASLVFTGARCQEICNLRQSDVLVSPDGMVQYYIRSLKHGVIRVVPAKSWFLMEQLNRYRVLWPTSARSPFIFTEKGGLPYPRLIYRIVKTAFPTASPHSFRHHYAALLASEGIHITIIQYLLGHRWLNTTAIYLGSLATGPAAEVWAKVDNRLRQSDFLYSRTPNDKELTNGLKKHGL
jgi:site-specific recombinase XerD